MTHIQLVNKKNVFLMFYENLDGVVFRESLWFLLFFY